VGIAIHDELERALRGAICRRILFGESRGEQLCLHEKTINATLD
jgi:hypothetical protein